MKNLIFTRFVIATFFIFSFNTVFAQKKAKQYEVWISSGDSHAKIKALLTEIKDSSVLVTLPDMYWSKNNDSVQIKEISFDNIDVLKIRKRGSILKGGMYGSVLGLGGGILTIMPYYKDFGVFAPFAAVYLCTLTTVTGGAIGIAAGTLKDRIPVKGSFDNFERYRSCLQDYSYQKETIPAKNPFEHKSYAGFTSGLSFPVGKFIANYSGMENQKMEKVGTGGNLEIGHRFTKNIGLLFIQNSSTFDIEENNSVNSANFYWSLGGMQIGPVFSTSGNKKISFEISPKIGFQDVSFYEEMEEKFNGTGLGFDVSGNLKFNYAKRWSLSVETQYLYSSLKYDNNRQGTIKTLAFNFGLLYRFSKYSL